MGASKWLEKPKTYKAELARLRRYIKTLLREKSASDNGRGAALLSEVDKLMSLLDVAGEDVPLSEALISSFKELQSKTKEFEGQCKGGLAR